MPQGWLKLVGNSSPALPGPFTVAIVYAPLLRQRPFAVLQAARHRALARANCIKARARSRGHPCCRARPSSSEKKKMHRPGAAERLPPRSGRPRWWHRICGGRAEPAPSMPLFAKRPGQIEPSPWWWSRSGPTVHVHRKTPSAPAPPTRSRSARKSGKRLAIAHSTSSSEKHVDGRRRWTVR